MKNKLALLLIGLFFSAFSTSVVIAQTKQEGKIDWTQGQIAAVGRGTATPSGNRMKDELRAVRAATILGQRALLETVKGVKIDSQKTIENRMIQEDTVHTRIEGAIQGARIVRQNVRWDGDRPEATVELRICLAGFGGCEPETSLVNLVAVDHRSEQSNAPAARLADMTARQENAPEQTPQVLYDSSRPVTGIVLNLQGMAFERVILPVVITLNDSNAPFTVYSVKSVEPQVIRTYGAIRYADSVEQARQIAYLGDNIMVAPVSRVTSENMIVIGYQVARLIRETTSHGNDYLKNAKVVISTR